MKLKNELFSFPNLSRLKALLLWGGVATIVFVAVYGYCNFHATQATHHYSLFFEFEKSIPLIPWMIYPYISLNFLFIFASFVIDCPDKVKGLCIGVSLCAFFAGVIFYFFPGQLGFIRVPVNGYEKIFQTMFEIDAPHNLFPSLHITYSAFIIWIMFKEKKNIIFQFFVLFWLFMITLSVILVHQHHLFDIVSGYLLFIIVYNFYYKKNYNKTNA